MKKFILFSIAVFISLSASSDILGDYARKYVKFDSKTYDFGDILVSDGKVECTFTFENISTKPVVIHTVISSCGCTTPEWTKEPVKPGEKGVIKATYTNDQVGSFDKTLSVYVSDIPRPVILRLRGSAHASLQNIEESYSTRAGAIGLRSNSFSLGYVDHNSPKEDYTQIVNTSSSAVRVAATEVSKGLKISFSENPVPAKKTARLIFTVDPSVISPEKWGRQNFTFKLSVNGKTQSQAIMIKTLIKEGFENMSKEELATAPAIEVEKSYFEFGNIKKGETKESVFVFKNTGRKDLVIHTIDVQSAATSIMTKLPVTIEPGKQARISVKYDSAKCTGTGEVVDVLSAITNAPAKPVLNLYVTGIVIN